MSWANYFQTWCTWPWGLQLSYLYKLGGLASYGALQGVKNGYNQVKFQNSSSPKLKWLHLNYWNDVHSFRRPLRLFGPLVIKTIVKCLHMPPDFDIFSSCFHKIQSTLFLLYVLVVPKYHALTDNCWYIKSHVVFPPCVWCNHDSKHQITNTEILSRQFNFLYEPIWRLIRSNIADKA